MLQDLKEFAVVGRRSEAPNGERRTVGDAGTIYVNGQKAEIHNPRDAKKYNIETIYQTLALADNQDAPANMFLGRELKTRFGNLDDAAMEDATRVGWSI